MVEKHPTKPGSDSKGRFIKGNRAGKLLNGLYDPKYAFGVVGSYFCTHCGHIGSQHPSIETATPIIGRHFEYCTNPPMPRDEMAIKFKAFKNSLRWDKSLNNVIGIEMEILTAEQLLQTMSELILERNGVFGSTPLALLAKHHKIGEDNTKREISEFTGFEFTLSVPPTKDKAEDKTEDK